MPLMPKRVKFRKFHKGRVRGNATRGNNVSFGEYGLQSLEPARISAQQIEAGRVAATHHLGREGRVYVRIFPHKSVSAKPLETRMGKGKGEPETWVAVVRPGTIMYEIGGVPEDLAREALSRVAHKMPVKVRMLRRRHGLA
jgi:large subunit ribosomal protein L16